MDDGGSIFIVLAWGFFAFIPAGISQRKGNGWAGMFFLSIMLSPLIGLIVALADKENTEVVRARMVESGSVRVCPFCAEAIQPAAILCPHCRSDLRPRADVPPPSRHAYYYNGTTGQHGPFSLDEMAALIDLGNVGANTSVFREGDGAWRSARDLPELAPYIG